MNIYAISQQYQELLRAVEEGELDPQEMEDTIQSLKDHIGETLENLASSYKNRMAFVESTKNEIERLKEKAAQVERQAENIKNFIDTIMRVNGIRKTFAGSHELKYRKGSEVVVIDETKLPKPEEAPDIYEEVPATFKLIGKNDLKKRLKAGEQIKGISLVRKPDSLKIE